MTISRLALSGALGAGAFTASVALPAGASEFDAWEMLSRITVDEQITETSYRVTKTFPAGFEQDIENTRITGYAVPLWAGDEVRELMLVTDMGNCPFCGSGDHGGNLMITLAEAVPAFEDGMRITLEGTLARVNDPETWQAAVLKDARIIAR